MGLRGPGARPKGVIPPTDHPMRGVTVPSRRPRAGPHDNAPAIGSRSERVIAFVESLRITSGLHAGEPFTLRPWQKEIVRAWYATDKKGRRIVRTGVLTLGRKNGKTALCAALCLAHLLGPEVEARGQVISAAT